jgi:hypothetical protein
MNLSIKTVFILFLLSCHNSKKEDAERGDQELVSTFRPAFDEASEITFLKTDTLSCLSILIRKNFRFDEKEDTFYYRIVTLDEKDIVAIQDKVLLHLDSNLTDQIRAVADGIEISYLHKYKNDTTFYSFHSPILDTAKYNLTSVTLNTYQGIFRDSIVNDYFNVLRGYITDSVYVDARAMTPLMKLREIKYAGFMKYIR